MPSSSDFKFLQDVTVNGKPAVFIGYMRDGNEAQVCLSSEKSKPNVIVPLGEISDLIRGSKPKPKPARVLPVSTGASA
jgi:hypothetical protein